MKTSKLNVLSKDVLNCNRCVDLGLIEHSRKFFPEQAFKDNPIIFFKEYTSPEELLVEERLADIIGVWVIDQISKVGIHSYDYLVYSTTLCTAVRSGMTGAKTACRKQCSSNIQSIVTEINPSIVACFGKASNTISKLKIPFVQLPEINSLTNAICAKRFLLLLKQISETYNAKKS